MEQLSLRLRTIAEFIPLGSRMADIGSDHALLPTYLAERRRIAYAVAGELNDGPCEAARRQVRKAGVGDTVAVRQGDGLKVLRADEVDVIVIAGMGGALITDILHAGKGLLHGVRRLILQPNVAEDQVRNWLKLNGWSLCEETIVEEDGHIYEILVAVRANEAVDGDAYRSLTLPCGLVVEEPTLLKMGPWLLRSPTPVFMRKWEGEARKLEGICRQIERSASHSARQRLSALRRELEQIREVIACLRTGKR